MKSAKGPQISADLSFFMISKRCTVFLDFHLKNFVELPELPTICIKIQKKIGCDRSLLEQCLICRIMFAQSFSSNRCESVCIFPILESAAK